MGSTYLHPVPQLSHQLPGFSGVRPKRGHLHLVTGTVPKLSISFATPASTVATLQMNLEFQHLSPGRLPRLVSSSIWSRRGHLRSKIETRFWAPLFEWVPFGCCSTTYCRKRVEGCHLGKEPLVPAVTLPKLLILRAQNQGSPCATENRFSGKRPASIRRLSCPSKAWPCGPAALQPCGPAALRPCGPAALRPCPEARAPRPSCSRSSSHHRSSRPARKERIPILPDTCPVNSSMSICLVYCPSLPQRGQVRVVFVKSQPMGVISPLQSLTRSPNGPSFKRNLSSFSFFWGWEGGVGRLVFLPLSSRCRCLLLPDSRTTPPSQSPP